MSVATTSQRRLHSVLAMVFALSLLALVATVPAQAAYPGANGRVAYVSNQGGSDTEIMSGAYDGSGSAQLTTNTTDDSDPAWSPDGTKIAFTQSNPSTGVLEIWTMNANGSGQAPLVTSFNPGIGNGGQLQPTWSPDGTKIAFTVASFGVNSYDIYVANTSGLNSGVTPVATTAALERDPAWSPVDGSKILFSYSSGGGNYELRTVNPASPNVETPLLALAGHDLRQSAWSPDGAKIAFRYESAGIWSADANGSNAGPIAAGGSERNPAFAPENNMFAFDAVVSGNTEISLENLPSGTEHVMEARGTTVDTNPDWQPVTAAQVRPKGASPLSVPLVIAFKPCTSPNATHSAPFPPFQSCTPPDQASNDLTVGEPLVNGKSPNFVGSLRLKALASSDGQLTVSMTDVRCARFLTSACSGGPLSDYTASLNLIIGFRITDRSNSPTAAGTVVDFGYATGFASPGVQCVATADPTIGSTCSLSTTLNTIVPGTIVSGRRAIWAFTSATLKDGKPNDFAVPGVFFP